MSSTEVSKPSVKLLRILAGPVLKIGLPFLVVLIGIFVLHELATHVKWSDVKADLWDVSPMALLAAIAATALSFIGISCYDMLAVHPLA